MLVDVEPDTLNIDPAAVAAAVTERTRVILPVHYGGHPCDMDALEAIAAAHATTLEKAPILIELTNAGMRSRPRCLARSLERKRLCQAL